MLIYMAELNPSGMIRESLTILLRHITRRIGSLSAIPILKKYSYIYIVPKFLNPIISEIRRKKTTIVFNLQNMFRTFLYPSSVAIIPNC